MNNTLSVVPPINKTKPQEHIRTGTSPETLKAAFLDNLNLTVGRPLEISEPMDHYHALALTVRDRIMQRWVEQVERWNKAEIRQVSYLSAEFLVGPRLGKDLINLDLMENAGQAMTQLGLDLEHLIGLEVDPGLGNGGLGRLASCYLDSMAALGYPAIGYGIRYEFGIFNQRIENGWQVEETDKWLRHGNIWEFARPHFAQTVKLGGHTEPYTDSEGNYRVRWIPARVVIGIPYDTPILGYQSNSCALLRLWRAEAAQSFKFSDFNQGDYYGAVEEKVYSENISKILYPNDEKMQGKRLRLEQQYFFSACSIKDMIRLCLRRGLPINRFHEMFCIQLNDTHPVIGIVELMRQLIDKYLLSWEEAWSVSRQSFTYTNHTLLPEALEKWPVALFAELLPRHLEIIYEINRRFLEEINNLFPGDNGRLARLSIVEEHGGKYIRMANLAVICSHTVNGVAKLHSELIKTQLFPDFFAYMPERFRNVTNGITPRRFIALSNPGLTSLIDGCIGPGWLKDLSRLRILEALTDSVDLQRSWVKVKQDNKTRLAKIIREHTGVSVDPSSLFDIQAKRIHEYKRQHLNLLNIITLYQRLKSNSNLTIAPRTFIFGGKAAPGYFMAKLIIKLINSVGDIINNDPGLRNQIKVVFLPNYNVKNAQNIYPAADLSEQISTAGKEASGTGNMKLAMNGAITIGTLDGANIEILDEVGKENFFLFGLTSDQAAGLKKQGYHPAQYYNEDEELKSALDLIDSGLFSNGDADLFRPLTRHLLERDDYLVMADYRAYVNCQQEVDLAYRDRERWTRMSILNVARSGKFSSDRAVREYAERIWNIEPLR